MLRIAFGTENLVWHSTEIILEHGIKELCSTSAASLLSLTPFDTSSECLAQIQEEPTYSTFIKRVSAILHDHLSRELPHFLSTLPIVVVISHNDINLGKNCPICIKAPLL